jgi:thiol:disulfide interchange protein DsbC
MNLVKLIKVVLKIALVFTAFNAIAAEQVEERLAKIIEQGFPDIDVSSVSSTPIENIYEVVIGTDVVYMTGDGRYIIRGDLIDMQERQNISKDVRSLARAKLLKTIPESEYIEFASKDSKDIIYVFTDVDCGYCRKLHKDVPELNTNAITVRYLAYPRGGLNSPAYEQMVNIWCAEDRPQALTDAKNGMPALVKTEANCKSPVIGQHALGQEMGMTGTPAIFLENGRSLPGYMPPTELLRELGR